MGAHERFGGPDHFSGGPGWLPLLFMGMSMLWLIAPFAITAAYLWWRSRRPALTGQPLVQPLVADEPSSFELLRRRYVVGEIDTPAFEEMTERLLVSEHVEERRQPLLARYDRYDHYLRRERQDSEPRDVML